MKVEDKIKRVEEVLVKLDEIEGYLTLDAATDVIVIREVLTSQLNRWRKSSEFYNHTKKVIAEAVGVSEERVEEVLGAEEAEE